MRELCDCVISLSFKPAWKRTSYMLHGSVNSDDVELQMLFPQACSLHNTLCIHMHLSLVTMSEINMLAMQIVCSHQ